MNQRLISEAAYRLGKKLAGRLNFDREEQVAEAVTEFTLICKEGIRWYEVQANRKQQRLHPTEGANDAAKTT
jgi:hypothetical protein